MICYILFVLSEFQNQLTLAVLCCREQHLEEGDTDEEGAYINRSGSDWFLRRAGNRRLRRCQFRRRCHYVRQDHPHRGPHAVGRHIHGNRLATMVEVVGHVPQPKGLTTSNRERSPLLFDLLSRFSYNTFGVCFANSNLFAAKGKLEIVSGGAGPHFRPPAGGFAGWTSSSRPYRGGMRSDCFHNIAHFLAHLL